MQVILVLVSLHAANGVSPFISILPPTPITFIIYMPSLHGCDSETTRPSAYLPVKWPSKFQSHLWHGRCHRKSDPGLYHSGRIFFFGRTFFFFGTVHLCTEFILMHMLTIVVVISCQGGRLGNEAVRRWQTILRIVQILLHLWAKLRIEHPKQIAALCGLLMEKHFALPVPAWYNLPMAVTLCWPLVCLHGDSSGSILTSIQQVSTRPCVHLCNACASAYVPTAHAN